MRAHLSRTATLLIALAPALSSADTGAPPPRGPAPPSTPKATPKPPPARPAQPGQRKPAAKAPGKKPPPEPALPPAPVRLWVIAPSPDGLWTLRLDNEGTRGVRIAADIRLLRFELDTGAKKPVLCAVPDGLRPAGFPEDRALLLAPGQSYIEPFEPRLICFGDREKALTGGAVVRSFFGWPPPSRWQKKQAGGPYIVEGIDMPETFAPEREIKAPTLVLSYAVPAPAPSAPAAAKPEGAPPAAAKPEGAPPAAAKPEGAPPVPGAPANPPMTDAKAARLELSAQPFVEAASHRGVTLTATAKNAGQRPMLVFLRSRMVSFKVEAPDGKVTFCGGSAATHAVPRDKFTTLKPGGTSAFTVMLSEVCERGTFQRPGLYRVTTTLDANESGEEVGVTAYTASVTAPKPTWIRLKTGMIPFYASPPQAVPTPKPQGEGEGKNPAPTKVPPPS